MKIDLSFGSKRYVLQALQKTLKTTTMIFLESVTLYLLFMFYAFIFVSLNLVAMPNHHLNFHEVHDKAP